MPRRPTKNFFFAKFLRFDDTSNSYKLKTETGENVDDKNVEEVKIARGVNDAGNVLPAGWACRKDGANALVFLYNNTPVMKIAATGEITSIHDIGAFGSV